MNLSIAATPTRRHFITFTENVIYFDKDHCPQQIFCYNISTSTCL